MQVLGGFVVLASPIIIPRVRPYFTAPPPEPDQAAAMTAVLAAASGGVELSAIRHDAAGVSPPGASAAAANRDAQDWADGDAALRATTADAGDEHASVYAELLPQSWRQPVARSLLRSGRCFRRVVLQSILPHSILPLIAVTLALQIIAPFAFAAAPPASTNATGLAAGAAVPNADPTPHSILVATATGWALTLVVLAISVFVPAASTSELDLQPHPPHAHAHAHGAVPAAAPSPQVPHRATSTALYERTTPTSRAAMGVYIALSTALLGWSCIVAEWWGAVLFMLLYLPLTGWVSILLLKVGSYPAWYCAAFTPPGSNVDVPPDGGITAPNTGYRDGAVLLSMLQFVLTCFGALVAPFWTRTGPLLCLQVVTIAGIATRVYWWSPPPHGRIRQCC